MNNIIIESCYLPARRVLGSGVYTSIIGSGVYTSIIGSGVYTSIIGSSVYTSIIGSGVYTSIIGSGVYTSIIGSGVCGSIISHDVRTQYHIHTIHVSCKLFSLCSWGHGISMRTHMCTFTHGQPTIADAYENKNY